MKSLWNDDEAKQCAADPLVLRVYTSRLLGREPELVLHGGGNTSVKIAVTNLFNEKEEILYVKGSGWDLAAIERQGFAPVRLNVLRRMAELDSLSDSEMVKLQRAAMIDPYAPNPSVEAILHAIIPFTFVDHTHADTVVAISNTKDGREKIREIYGPRVLVIPYVMPGFVLAKKVYEMTQDADWQQLDGMVLLHHGVITFGRDARGTYERMIQMVSRAEDYLKAQGVIVAFPAAEVEEDLLKLAQIRCLVSRARKTPVIARLRSGPRQINFANHAKPAWSGCRGPLTPDHVLRTKRIPVVIKKDPEADLKHFQEEYQKYFKRHAYGDFVCLDSAPRWAVWPGHGTISFDATLKDVGVIDEITDHTMDAIGKAEALGGWQPLSEKEIFDVEYWELEQAKLKRKETTSVFQGKIALVTGAAGGIGRACVEALHAQGAVVAALDIRPAVKGIFNKLEILGLVCDVTKEEEIQKAVETVVREFGGLDIVVSNAGIFPAGEQIERLDSETWQKSLDINLSSHQFLLKQCIPYLRAGVDPAVVVVASKNVPAPGPGAAAYSVAKAGLTQLARVAALELAPSGIRVNVVHPNQVFDTGVWTKEILENRARHYGLSVEEYKKSNLLRVEISSQDVAQVICALAGPVFSKTTGAQIPIDGGNERVV